MVVLAAGDVPLRGDAGLGGRAGAAGAATRARRGVERPLWLAIAVLVPIVPIIGLAVYWWGNTWRFDRAFPELPIWAAGMLLTLWAAGTLAGRGKVRAGWIAGILGAVLTAQLAVMTVMRHLTTGVDWGHSPLWLVSYFNYRAAVDNVRHEISPTPELYLVVVPYALAFVITAARQMPGEAAEAVQS